MVGTTIGIGVGLQYLWYYQLGSIFNPCCLYGMFDNCANAEILGNDMNPSLILMYFRLKIN